VITFLLECGLHLLLEHAQLFLRRLLSLPHSRTARGQQLHQHMQQVRAGGGFAWGAGAEALHAADRRSEQPLSPDEQEAVARAKMLETYREKLGALVIQLRCAVRSCRISTLAHAVIFTSGLCLQEIRVA
jgi:hypothetical protein